MPVDLTERISTAQRCSYVGTGFRQQSPKYDPLSGEGARIHGGRFNPPESFPVLYLCSTPGCAAAEFMRFVERHPIGVGGHLPRTLYHYDVELTSVLDLTAAATCDHLELTPAQLIDQDQAVTQHIGETAHQFGYQAVLNASATGVDAVLAVLIENLRGGRLEPRVDSLWETAHDLPIF